MGKRKHKSKEYKIDDKSLEENEAILYGSTNGWLRTVGKGGVEMFLVPEKHTPEDEPAAWYLVGKYRMEEVDNANG